MSASFTPLSPYFSLQITVIVKTFFYLISIVTYEVGIIIIPFYGVRNRHIKGQLGRPGVWELNLGSLFLEAELRSERAVIRCQETV